MSIMLILFLEGTGRGRDGTGTGRDVDGTGWDGRGLVAGWEVLVLEDDVPGQRRVPLLVCYICQNQPFYYYYLINATVSLKNESQAEDHVKKLN